MFQNSAGDVDDSSLLFVFDVAYCCHDEYDSNVEDHEGIADYQQSQHRESKARVLGAHAVVELLLL